MLPQQASTLILVTLFLPNKQALIDIYIEKGPQSKFCSEARSFPVYNCTQMYSIVVLGTLTVN